MVLFYAYLVMILRTIGCYINISLYVSALNVKIYGIVSLSLMVKTKVWDFRHCFYIVLITSYSWRK